MKKLSEIKFKELQKYLNNNYCFGLTVSRKEHILVYHFVRFFNKVHLSLNVLVSRKTKCVIGVKTKNNTYDDLDELKKIVDYGK